MQGVTGGFILVMKKDEGWAVEASEVLDEVGGMA